MNSTLRRTIAAALCLAATALFANAAKADMTIVESTSVHSPQMDAMMKGSGMRSITSTLYIAGNKIRTDNQFVSVIMDGSAHKMIMLMPTNHSYSSQPFDPAMYAKMAKNQSVTVSDTGQTKVILGHKAHHYLISMTMAMPQMGGKGGGGMTAKGDIWSATDITVPAMAGMSGGMGMMNAKIKGLPLVTVLEMTSPMTGKMTTTTKVVSISTSTVSPSLFAVPPGYTENKGGMGMGMPGRAH